MNGTDDETGLICCFAHCTQEKKSVAFVPSINAFVHCFCCYLNVIDEEESA